MDINSVNYDDLDLFEFSPESQDQQHQPEQPCPTSPSPPPYIPAAKVEFKLSQSVPSSWGGSSSSSSHQQQPQEAGLSTLSFNASVGQLLDDLPCSGGHAAADERSPSSDVRSSGGQGGKRGRKPGQRNLKTDMKSKLERSRQSARECRARKKCRYQYLDDLILEREKANVVLRDELIKFQKWCHDLDRGIDPKGLQELLQELKMEASPR